MKTLTCGCGRKLTAKTTNQLNVAVLVHRCGCDGQPVTALSGGQLDPPQRKVSDTRLGRRGA